MSLSAAPPLAGLTVLDFTRVIAGPYLTQAFADLGADVIKVEAPGTGDEFRTYRPAGWTEDAPGFVGLNRNKRSIAIDLANPAGRALCLELAAKADILVENFRPDVMAKYGLDYGSLAAANPGLIYCSISGYGQSGPFRLVAGYDPIAQAETGMMYLTGPAELEPQKAGGSVGDSLTGLHAGMAVLSALHARHRDGQGQHVEVSLFDCVLATLGYVGAHPLLTGNDPPRMGNKSYALVPLGCFECSDGPIMIVVGNDRQFTKFCRDVLQRPDLLDDPRFATIADRMANREAIEAEIEAIFRSNVREHWVQRMRAAGVPGGAVRSPQEAVRSPEAAARDMIRKARFNDREIDVVGNPFKFSRTPAVAPTAIPKVGEHTHAVLQGVLDYDTARIDALAADGAFG